MKSFRRRLAAAACSAGLTLVTITAHPAAAEIVSVSPGTMYCQNGFVHVETPSLSARGDGVDMYAPVLEYWAPGAEDWVAVAVGNVLQKSRLSEYWVDENVKYQAFHEFNISDPQKGHYWRVVQGVRDGETGRTWQVYAVLRNHDPDYCDATGYWDQSFRVDVVAPGAIITPLIKDAADTIPANPIPLRRFGQPDEGAETAFFLADGKAGFINGTTVSINGGFTIQ